MLIDGLIKILWFSMDMFLEFLPPWDIVIPPEVLQTLKYMRAFDSVMPVTEFLLVVNACILTVFGMLIVKMIIKAADWIADIIP